LFHFIVSLWIYWGFIVLALVNRFLAPAAGNVAHVDTELLGFDFNSQPIVGRAAFFSPLARDDGLSASMEA
jgi:ABC-type antimicrobial peptide transport system permease subunit